MTWTSIGPDSRTTRLMTEPRMSSCHRDCAGWRRARAGWRSRPGRSRRARRRRRCPATSWYSPPSSSSSRRCSPTWPSASRRQAVVGADVHAEQLAVGPLGDAGGPPDEVVAAGRAGEGHDHPLAGLPRLGDAVALAVLLEGVVDPVGHPQQRQLAEGAEVAGPEVVGRGRRRSSRRRRCCRGPCAGAGPRGSCRPARSGRPPARRRRGRSRAGATPVIRSTTSLSDSRCWMLTVEITSMPAASSSSTSCQRFSLREPGTLVWASSSTSATSGRRARTASTSISSNVGAAVLERRGGARPRGRRPARRCGPGRGSRRSRRRRRCPAPAGAGPR